MNRLIFSKSDVIKYILNFCLQSTGVGRSLGLLDPAVATAKATAAFAELDLKCLRLFSILEKSF